MTLFNRNRAGMLMAIAAAMSDVNLFNVPLAKNGPSKRRRAIRGVGKKAIHLAKMKEDKDERDRKIKRRASSKSRKINQRVAKDWKK